MSADRATYLDSSAIVKLVVREPESTALRGYLRRRRPLVSSALARTEVARAVLSFGAAVARRAQDVLDRIELVRVNDRVLVEAGTVAESRYQQFVQHLVEQFSGGRRFLDDLPRESIADEDGSYSASAAAPSSMATPRGAAGSNLRRRSPLNSA
jgi:hypothetical protein